MATNKKQKNGSKSAAGKPVGMTFGEELEQLDQEAASLGIGRATLVRMIVRKRYGFPNPLGETPAK